MAYERPLCSSRSKSSGTAKPLHHVDTHPCHNTVPYILKAAASQTVEPFDV